MREFVFADYLAEGDYVTEVIDETVLVLDHTSRPPE